MGCCGEREKFGGATNEQRWDYINLKDFRCTSCWTGFSYGIVWYFLVLSIGVYAVDLFVVTNLLFFNRWSSQIKPPIPFEISRWIFAGCIILSYVLLAYRWWRALRAMKTGVITASYLDPLAVRIESVRVTKKGQGFRRFVVFAALTKGRKGSEYVALFTYFSFEAWLRIIFAEGPRVAINGITLYSVMRADLLPVGGNAASHGHTPVVQFFVNMQILANHNKQQAAILLGMLYTLVVWVFSAISLAIAFLMYILFLWHHIPSQDGSLSRFCRRKIEKRLRQIVQERVNKALAKDMAARVKEDTNATSGVSNAADYKRQPTLPVLTDDASTISPISRAPTRPDLNPFESRPSTPDIISRPGTSQASREPTIPDVFGNTKRPGAPSRTTTQSSLHSDASYASDKPLMDSAAAMGYDQQSRSTSRNGPSRMESERTLHSARPPPRSYTSSSQNTQRSYSSGPSRMGTPARQNTDVSGTTRFGPPSRTNTDLTSISTAPAGRNPPLGAMHRDPSLASMASTQRNRGGPSPVPPRPNQEYEMQPPNPASGFRPPPRSSSAQTTRTPFQPPRSQSPASFAPTSSLRNVTQPNRPPIDYFGQARAPPRAGTAPIPSHTGGYDPSIYDAYGADRTVPYRPATAGPHGRAGYNPPRF